MAAHVTSAFGDEVHPDLDRQLDGVAAAGFDHVDLRGVGGRNVIDLDEPSIRRVREAVRERDLRVAGIGSPVGKVDITGGRELGADRSAGRGSTESLDDALGRLDRAMAVADALDAGYVRVFAYLIPDRDHPDDHREEVLRRMKAEADAAEDAGITLLVENLPGSFADTPDRVRDVLSTVDSPRLRAAYDPVNFLRAGATPYPDAYEAISDFVEGVHVKDARATDGGVEHVPPDAGDTRIGDALRALLDGDFDGVLSLEPHLSIDDADTGLSGSEGFERAARAFRALLE